MEKEQKKKKPKLMIIINVIGIVIIAFVAVYFIFIKDSNQKPTGNLGNFWPGNGNIEEICERFISGDGLRGDGRQTPPGGLDGANQFKGELQSICADGEVSADEKERFDELIKNLPAPGSRDGSRPIN